jgi:gliding motility-associated-like protein
MKKFVITILTTFLLLFAALTNYAQIRGNMQTKTFNFSSFSKQEQNITQELRQRTEGKYRQHPEYGVLPHNTQCSDCIELIHKRDYNSRYFIEPGTDGVHFFKQKALTPLHYKTEEAWLRTIDKHLQPVQGKPGKFAAPHQPIPTAYDSISNETAIRVDSFEFAYNANLQLYLEKNNATTENYGKADYGDQKIGEDGVLVKNAWPTIDIRHEYRRGRIKTDFVINKPLGISQNSGYLVFEDEISLPKSFAFQHDSSDNWTEKNGYWSGDLMVQRPNGEKVISYGRPKYYDQPRNNGQGGYYEYRKANGSWHLKMLVPVDFLKDPSLTYPVTIDPIVAGYDSLGNLQKQPPHGGPSGNLAFTNVNSGQGYCPYDLSVTIEERVELFDILIGSEFETTFPVPQICDPSTGGCQISDIRQQVVTPCDSISLICTDSIGRYCTTDSHRVATANPLRISGLMDCVTPECPNYDVQFTLKNIQLKCPETCDYNCATAHYFAITVEGREVREDIDFNTSNGTDSVCAGEPVELISLPEYGVPVYDYQWSPGGQTDSIITVNPTEETTYTCTVTDSCGNTWSASKTIHIKPTPEAKAGINRDVCEGGQLTLGGSPTGPPGSSFQWSAVQPWASGYLSQPNSSSPQVTIPSDSFRTYGFSVKVENSQCFRYDTVFIANLPKPEPGIEPDSLAFCPGKSGTLGTATSYDEYQWSNGDTSASIEVTQRGDYNVTVTDNNGCSSSATPASVNLNNVLDVEALPDTTIVQGKSTELYANIDLTSNQVQSYSWSPSMNLSCTNCPEPTVNPSKAQTYRLDVTSAGGCKSSDTARITIDFLDEYSIPSGFSPNDDGYNDEFYIIKDQGVTVKAFRVYNRWGEKVHEGTEPWDGLYQNRPQPVGVYMYYLTLQLSDGREIKEQGNVTLVR